MPGCRLLSTPANTSPVSCSEGQQAFETSRVAQTHLFSVCWLHYRRVARKGLLHDVLHDELMCWRSLLAPLLLQSMALAS